MVGKIVVLLFLYALFLGSDWKNLKKINRKEGLAYGAIMLGTVYLGIIFVTGNDWPNLNDLINLLLSKPAKIIMKTFAS
jgi:hypothetical protein